MDIPGAFQTPAPFGANVGGVNPAFLAYPSCGVYTRIPICTHPPIKDAAGKTVPEPPGGWCKLNPDDGKCVPNGKLAAGISCDPPVEGFISGACWDDDAALAAAAPGSTCATVAAAGQCAALAAQLAAQGVVRADGGRAVNPPPSIVGIILYGPWIGRPSASQSACAEFGSMLRPRV
jgi:hypothetical protein